MPPFLLDLRLIALLVEAGLDSPERCAALGPILTCAAIGSGDGGDGLVIETGIAFQPGEHLVEFGLVAPGAVQAVQIAARARRVRRARLDAAMQIVRRPVDAPGDAAAGMGVGIDLAAAPFAAGAHAGLPGLIDELEGGFLRLPVETLPVLVALILLHVGLPFLLRLQGDFQPRQLRLCSGKALLLGKGGCGDLALKARKVGPGGGKRFGALQGRFGDRLEQPLKAADETDRIALIAQGKILAAPIAELALREDRQLQSPVDAPDRGAKGKAG